MIHRTVFGSLERFIAILTEHYGGAFPLWLAPVQVAVLPITDRAHVYAHSIVDALTDAGYRAEGDFRNEKIGLKIREAQLQKTPYMLVLGDKEAESSLVTVRKRAEGDIGAMELGEFIETIGCEIQSRK